MAQTPDTNPHADLVAAICALIAKARADEQMQSEPINRAWRDKTEAQIRADERERWGLGWVAAADNVQAFAHAEAVASRLVEVICSEVEDVEGLHRIIGDLDMKLDLACDQREHWHAQTLARATELHNALTERDAARAEVAALRRELDDAALQARKARKDQG